MARTDGSFRIDPEPCRQDIAKSVYNWFITQPEALAKGYPVANSVLCKSVDVSEIGKSPVEFGGSSE
jgi:hypothetical protein